ncbi:unnamed protein product [Trichogramma brassicae]|uniref:N-acetyltransferase domain-containing protein n=1 Tax=Trichogramma brassicae TaxID=86971 RepID=A0A6H5IW81_9HYME|nr:unnamed protein product [Trichogramma brassicae]
MSLYASHRACLGQQGSLRARQAREHDLTYAADLLEGVESAEAILEDLRVALEEDSAQRAFVFTCDEQIVGLAVLRREEQVNRLERAYRLGHLAARAKQDEDSSGRLVQLALMPIFVSRLGFLLGEILRLAEHRLLFYRLLDSDQDPASRSCFTVGRTSATAPSALCWPRASRAPGSRSSCRGSIELAETTTFSPRIDNATSVRSRAVQGRRRRADPRRLGFSHERSVRVRRRHDGRISPGEQSQAGRALEQLGSRTKGFRFLSFFLSFFFFVVPPTEELRPTENLLSQLAETFTRIVMSDVAQQQLGSSCSSEISRTKTRFVKPMVVSCLLPGGYRFLRVSKPGPIEAAQNDVDDDDDEEDEEDRRSDSEVLFFGVRGEIPDLYAYLRQDWLAAIFLDDFADDFLDNRLSRSGSSSRDALSEEERDELVAECYERSCHLRHLEDRLSDFLERHQDRLSMYLTEERKRRIARRIQDNPLLYPNNNDNDNNDDGDETSSAGGSVTNSRSSSEESAVASNSCSCFRGNGSSATACREINRHDDDDDDETSCST